MHVKQYNSESCPDYFRAFTTDTFAGELNFCWKRDALIYCPDRPGEDWQKKRQRVYRAARKALGMTGLRGAKADFGDLINFRPAGACMAMIVELGECWFNGTPEEIQAEKDSAIVTL